MAAGGKEGGSPSPPLAAAPSAILIALGTLLRWLRLTQASPNLSSVPPVLVN